MSKFLKLNISRQNHTFENLEYLPDVINLINCYKTRIFDDYFFDDNQDLANKIIDLIEKVSPYFWVIVRNNGDFIGFVYLDDWQGSEKRLHCAAVTTCILPKYWGAFTKKAGKRFIRYVFRRYKLQKLKAEVYSNNQSAVTLLKKIGFSFESRLINETIVRKTPVNIDIYTILK